MIRILVADRLSPKALDLLNEIPEFEINEKAELSAARLLEEIKNADALVVSGSVPLTEELLKSSGDLKLIVRSSNVSGPVDEASARRQNIEIRTAVGHGTHQAAGKNMDEIGVDVIVILKDFFNV
jgi:D-3-phosphoglycerate dehydrogenase / 2-oxoglutarate reductase